MSPATRLSGQLRFARSPIRSFRYRCQAHGQSIFRNSLPCRALATTAAYANILMDAVDGVASPPLQSLVLPKTCPGCGAYTQKTDSNKPGFFSISRKSIKEFMGHGLAASGEAAEQEAEAFMNVLKHTDQSTLGLLGFKDRDVVFQESKHDHRLAISERCLEMPPAPVCDRCHHLRHHNTGASITHPTLESVGNIISKSPFNYNHIYHVIDAADFPLSLIPSLQRHLSLSPQRSLNRRSKKIHYQQGSIFDMSYVITRADLLAPKKEQVDKIMPYIVDVLRNALGGSARDMRLGNVHCVSSKRGWWTKNLKEDIYRRGGGGWMVGKVNVGKSNLFENVFPKGHKLDVLSNSLRGRDPPEASEGTSEDSIYSTSALPPELEESPFPIMPLVSSTPGTTASPIRLSFGNRKGELVDLPGVNRGGLESFVIDGHKRDLVMQKRIEAKQFTINTGQSLLVDGLIQISPVTPGTTLLAYPFVPLKCHVTTAEKALSIIMQSEAPGFSTIARPGLGSRMQTAGVFPLKWDVTKVRAGPLTAKAAAGLQAKSLPFVVLSTDILIEGCGWIELVAQVRKKQFTDSENAQTKRFFDDKNYPMVEIKSPDGRHVGYRRPMGAWVLGGEKSEISKGEKKESRRSMKGARKKFKRMSEASNRKEK